jgi:hypothetical protein
MGIMNARSIGRKQPPARIGNALFGVPRYASAHCPRINTLAPGLRVRLGTEPVLNGARAIDVNTTIFI